MVNMRTTRLIDTGRSCLRTPGLHDLQWSIDGLGRQYRESDRDSENDYENENEKDQGRLP